VITVWGSDVFVGPRESPMHRRWGRRTLSNADMVTAVSEDLAREAVELGARPEVTRIVQFGFDPAVFAPAPPPSRPCAPPTTWPATASFSRRAA
jgi:hypothetical protein